MNAGTPAVTTVLKEVQTDRDRLVQQEAWTVLMQLVRRPTETR
jgi:hypothetical protein